MDARTESNCMRSRLIHFINARTHSVHKEPFSIPLYALSIYSYGIVKASKCGTANADFVFIVCHDLSEGQEKCDQSLFG